MHREPGHTKPKPKPKSKSIHGRPGPTTPAEDQTREIDPDIVSGSDKAKIAEAASREEDA
jgi:hypothetical protein